MCSANSPHDLEQEILRLRQMPDNRARNRQIKKLVEELAPIKVDKTGEQVVATTSLNYDHQIPASFARAIKVGNKCFGQS